MRNGALLSYSVHGSVLCRPTGRRVRRGVGALTVPMLRSSGNGFLAASRRCYAQMWTSSTFPAEQANRFKISSFRKSADDYKHGRHVSIQWKDNTESKYHLKWLRDNCLCEACMDQDSGQRIFRVVDSDERMSHASASSVSSNEESLSVVWTDGHESSFPSSWLRRYCYGQTAKQERRRQRQPVLWMGNFWSSSSTSSSPAPSLDFEYDSIMNSDERRWEWLRHMSLYGLSVIRNVPTRDQEVMNVAQRTAGMIQDTIYGRSWDVKSVEKAHNIAYTAKPLHPHMDLLYYESPPGVQFLHCLEYKAVGGLNTFADGFKICEVLKEKNRKAFDTLVRVSVTYHFQDKDHWMHYRRPSIVLNDDGDIVQFNHSPIFEGPLDINFEDVEPFYSAYRELIKLARDETFQHKLQMQAGDLVAFNNRRVLHARTAYQGPRHLQGTYVSTDEFLKHYRVLQRRFETDPSIRLGVTPKGGNY